MDPGQQLEPQRVRLAPAHHGPRVLGGARQRRQFAKRRPGGDQRGQQLLLQRIAVARSPEPPEQGCQLRLPGGRSGRGRGAGQGTEIAQRTTQPPQSDPALVQVFGRGGAGRQFAGVGQHLFERIAQHRAQGLSASHGRMQERPRGLDRRHRVQGTCQPVAAFGLAAHVQPQVVPRHPPCRQCRQRGRRTAQQFEFQLQHRLDPTRALHLALVERDFDQRPVAGADLAPGAADVGGEDFGQFAGGASPQHLAQGGARRGAVMPRQVERRRSSSRRHGHFLLAALHDPVATRLDGLCPLPAVPTQPQRQAGRRQPAVGRVEVARLQPLRGRRGGRHRAPHTRFALARHLELQLDFRHGCGLVPCSPARGRRPASRARTR